MAHSVERLRTGVEGFDELIAGGIPRGFFVAVVGEPGTGKTVFCIHFAWQGILDGDKVIYVTTEESRESIIGQAAMFGMDFAGAVDRGRMIIIDALMKSREDEWSLQDLDLEEMVEKVIAAKKALGYGRARLIIDSMSAFWLDKPAMARKYSYMAKRLLYRWDFTTLAVSQYAITTQSLPPDVPIIIRKHDTIKIVTIGEFVDKYLKTEGIKDVSKEGYYTLSINPKTFKVEWKKIKYVIKHKRIGKIYDITASHGRRIKVTGDHSIYILSPSYQLVSISADKVRKGDMLVTPTKIHLEEKLPKYINVAKELWSVGTKNLYIIDLPDKIVKDPAFIEACKALGRNKGVSYYWIKEERAPLNLLIKVYDDRVWSLIENSKVKIVDNKSASEPLPVKLKLNGDFFRLLGYIVSDGYVGKNRVVIHFGINEADYANDVINIIRNLFDNIEVKIYKYNKYNKISVYIYSRVLAELLRRVFKIKPGAAEKEVPPHVFIAPQRYKIEFLKGLYAGDGSFNKVNGSLIYTSVSIKLINGLSLLLLSLGIYSYSIRIRKDNIRFKYRNPVYDLIITKADDLMKLKEVIMHLNANPPKRNYIVDQIRVVPKHMTVELMKTINAEGVRTSPTYTHLEKYKYTTSTRIIKKIFNASKISKIIIEILKSEENNNVKKGLEFLKTFIEGDIGFVEVREKTRAQDTEYVYDLSVEDNENFLAGLGWLLVHNSAFGWGIEHVADGIIRFRKSVRRGVLRRYVLVEKMRQTPHDLRMHAVEIVDGRGMTVTGPVKYRREDVVLPKHVMDRILRALKEADRETP